MLVVKPSSLGDLVHALPAVEAIARRHPQWQLDWVANSEWLPLVEGHPALRRVIEFPRRRLRGTRAVGGFLRWCRALRAGAGYDLALDFQGLQRSALIAKASGARRRLGLDDAREGAGWLHTRRVPTAGRLHAVARCFALAEACGVEPGALARPEAGRPCLPEGGCPARATGEGLEGGGFVVVHPFSRGRGKALAPEDIARLLDGLAAAGRRVVLVGRAQPDGLAAGLPDGVLDLTNATSLAELCWVLRRSAATISVDSGPMHLAAALPAPLLALHAWSDPRKVGPWRRDAAVWKQGELATRETIDPALAAGTGELGAAAVAAALEWAARTRH